MKAAYCKDSDIFGTGSRIGSWRTFPVLLSPGNLMHCPTAARHY